MKKQDRKLYEDCAKRLDNEQLKEAYYKAVLDCLGSQTDRMYELGYDMVDIEEQAEHEQGCCDFADILEEECFRRGIKLWG